MSSERGNWGTRFGFVLAAAGSAVGLGNVWKFPYVTGVNGGGVFVVVYLLCVATVGLPIMIAEILLGRATQRSPIVAFRKLSAERSGWVLVGWLGVASGFVILSYYSVVAGWVMHYAWLALTDSFTGLPAREVGAIFSGLVASPSLNLLWHAVFMSLTIAVVIGGVRSGIERWSRILMPALFLMFVGLAIYAATLSGFGKAVEFVFGSGGGKLEPAGFLEALGQAFFTLSLGMGAMLTYGSYLPKDTDLVKASLSVAGLDTLIALLASMVIFPIIFSNNMEPQAGPGLVFMSIPIAFAKMPGGHLLGSVFFLLLLFAALTSAISLLEVLASSFIDIYGWPRRKVALITGGVTFVVGIPSALSGGDFFGAQLTAWLGRSFFDLFDYLATNWMLPAGGLLIALYTGWFLQGGRRSEEFRRGTSAGAWIEGSWLWMLRLLAPLAVVAVMAKSTGLLAALGVEL